MSRNLAAILAADVVGFSKMMGADEAKTLATLVALRHECFEPCVAKHNGTVVKRMGDGWLVEFSSALDAVTCAIDVQETLSDHPTFKLRIGVHLGDIVRDEEGDIYGDGVNTAARLEAVASPGGVAISDQVYNSLDGASSSVFLDGGHRDLKNIARPVRVWHWPIVALNSPEARPSGKNAVPVILLEPFSLGGDTQAAADIALDVQSGLQTAIASRSGVRISMPPAKDLKPTYLLNGRCRVSGEKCRLNLSIVVTANGETCWSTQIDGETTDTFGFIDDVIWQVGAAVRVQLNAHAGEAFAAEQDETLSGQQLLSKAAFLMNKYDPKKMTQALETMTAAFAKAPEHPMTLAMYSYTLMQKVPLAMEQVENVDVENVLSLADQAVHFGPKVDYVFHNRARIRLWLKRDHGGCRQDANRALEINPGFHFANEDLALVALFGGEIASGIESLRSIIKQLPTHPTTPYRSSILSIGCAVDGDLDQALASATDAYERKPNVRLHALAYAAAASGTPSITGSRKFRDMVATHQLSVLDADRFPFSQERDKRTLAALLARSGLPK